MSNQNQNQEQIEMPDLEEMEITLGLIKPDAFMNGNVGQIINLIELNQFIIAGLKMQILDEEEAKEFYAVHKDRPFFGELVEYITSGPIIAIALLREDAVKVWRDLMGATDPLKANPGTLRAMFGDSIGANATHGSDSPENAEKEVAFFFPELADLEDLEEEDSE